MKEVVDVFWNFRSRWKFIGIELGIDGGTLDAIDKDHRESEDSLVKLISTWLRGNNPIPTRSAMATALNSQQVIGGVTSVHGV